MPPLLAKVPEEEPAVEAAPAAEEKESFPSDFKLSLDELKFGRNYGTDK